MRGTAFACGNERIAGCHTPAGANLAVPHGVYRAVMPHQVAWCDAGPSAGPVDARHAAVGLSSKSVNPSLTTARQRHSYIGSRFTVHFWIYNVFPELGHAASHLGVSAWGVCDDDAMITTLRHRLITMHGRLGHHAIPRLTHMVSGIALRRLLWACWPTWSRSGEVADATDHQRYAATRLRGVTWRKSCHSNPRGNCVELPGGGRRAQLPAPEWFYAYSTRDEMTGGSRFV